MSYDLHAGDAAALRQELASVRARQELLADALAAATDELEKLVGLKEALIKIGTQQQRTLGWLTQNKIVFDSLGNDPSNWQHVAFSIYNDLCEVDAWAKEALA